jgi:hypothetical protein
VTIVFAMVDIETQSSPAVVVADEQGANGNLGWLQVSDASGSR